METLPLLYAFCLKQKTAANQRKTAYSGCFGTPGETRTHYIPLRRRTLYPGEVRGHEPKYFTPFVRACQLRKLLTQAARRPHIKNRPRAGLPGAGQNTAGGQRIRSADYVIPYHGIIGKRVLSKNIISARVTKYITSICSINPPKYSESMHITTIYAFCSSFQKKLFQNQLCPRRPDRKTKSPSAKADGLWWGRVDSNHRRHCQQIYSLSPLATRELLHIQSCVNANSYYKNGKPVCCKANTLLA